MNWLFPSVIATISSTSLLALVFLYLYQQDRQPYLFIWTGSWILYTLRFLFLLFTIQGFPQPFFFWANQFCALASGLLLVYGSYRFLERSLPGFWLWGGAASSLWLTGAFLVQVSFLQTTLPVFLFLGLSYILTGWAFLHFQKIDGLGKSVVGIAFILWGLHKFNYPFLRPVEWLAPWGYLFGSLLALAIAVGILLIYFEKNRNDLQKSEQRFRLLAENAQDVIFRYRVGRPAGFEYISPAVHQMLGYEPEECYRSPSLPFETILPEDRPLLREVLEGQRVSREPRTLRLRHRDGQLIRAELHYTPVREAGGELIAIEGILRDITSRYQAEAMNALLQRHNTLILQAVGEGIFGMDPEGRVTFVNPAAARLLGWEAEELIGQRMHEVCHHSHADGSPRREMDCRAGHAMQDGQPRHVTDDVFWRRDGSSFPVEYICTPMRDNDQIVGVVITFMAITERKKAEEEKKKLQNQLLQAQKVEAIGQLAGGIAHDFNNLLMAISGYGQLALHQLEPDHALRKEIEEILKAAKRASSLTRQLLAFSRQQPLKPQVVNLNTLVGEMEKMLRRLIGEDIHLATELAADARKTMADPGQLEQVILNLAVNARDAMPSGGKLTIKTTNFTLDQDNCDFNPNARPGDFVLITVEDTGTGMNRELTERIFEPFFSTKGLQGTGLGLSVIYGIVKQHEGWINVYSEPGQGSTFRIYLPACPLEATAGPAAPLRVENFQGNGARILLVEDEGKVRRLVSRVLQSNGYQIFEADSARKAQTILAEQQIDLLFTDVVLPDRSGLQLIDEVPAGQVNLKFLVTSGYTDHKSQWPIILERGLPFLEKPYPLTTLLRTVRDLLDEKKVANLSRSE